MQQIGYQWFNVESSVSVQRRQTKFIYSGLQLDGAKIVPR